MSYNKNIEEINQICANVKKTQDMIFELLKKYEKYGLKIKNEDIFLFKELLNKFKLDRQLIVTLLNINIMNYSRYMKSLDKNINNMRREIQKNCSE